jgi:hypothetical protein
MKKIVLILAILILAVAGLWFYTKHDGIFIPIQTWNDLHIDQSSTLSFETRDTYSIGESAEIVIDNVGTSTYRYSDLTLSVHVYRVVAGFYKEVVGNYTDNIVMFAGKDYSIRPNATTSIGSFPLVGCLSTEPGFACPGTRPLPPGKYLLVGQFPCVPYVDGCFSRIAKEIRITE